MRLPIAALVLALATPAVAAPTVRVASSSCTTEPAPTAPIVRAHGTRGTVHVTVVGAGHLCAAGWTAAIAGRTLTLTADASVDAPACPSTCAIDLVVRGVARGAWTVRVE